MNLKIGDIVECNYASDGTDCIICAICGFENLTNYDSDAFACENCNSYFEPINAYKILELGKLKQQIPINIKRRKDKE